MAIWHAKRTWLYDKESIEGWDNIQLIFSNLVRRGFTDAAACGVIANIEQEGGFNPWRWQDDILIASTDYNTINSDTTHGYGLCGWTPSGKYLIDNWSNLGLYPSGYKGYAPNYLDVTGDPSDGHAQCIMIVEGQQYNWVTSGAGRVNVSVSQFRALTDPQDAAEVWCRNYEYPRDLHNEVIQRRAAVGWYYDRLNGTTPVPDPVEHTSGALVAVFKKIADHSQGFY